MAKYQKSIPAKTASNLTTLAARFDEQGNPTEVKWFTEKGFSLIPDDLNYDKKGGRTRVKNGGWKKVLPEDFEAAPAPLTADQVTGGPNKVADPNKVVETTGTDPNDVKTENDGAKTEPGDTDTGGDKGKEKASGKETAKADPKPEKQK